MTPINSSLRFTPCTHFGLFLRAARAALRWSVRDLAKAANVSTSTVSKYENNHTLVPNFTTERVLLVTLENNGTIKFAPDVNAALGKSKVAEIKAAPTVTNEQVLKGIASAIAKESEVVAEQEGFMRRALRRIEVRQGDIPRVLKLCDDQNFFTIACGDEARTSKILEDTVCMYPPEFTIQSFIPLSDLEAISKSTNERLCPEFNEFYNIMLSEDLHWLNMLDNANTYPPMASKDLSKLLTNAVIKHDVPNDSSLFLPPAVVTHIIANMLKGFDPVTKYELIQTGYLGTISVKMGKGASAESRRIHLLTDAYRQPQYRVLKENSMYLVGPPEKHGVYTLRGAIGSTSCDQGGCLLHETVSMLIDPASVIKLTLTK